MHYGRLCCFTAYVCQQSDASNVRYGEMVEADRCSRNEKIGGTYGMSQSNMFKNAVGWKDGRNELGLLVYPSRNICVKRDHSLLLL